ncbi:pyridoxine/pyridoxamine 5'-phosphate oxidase [Aspergillus puulaauensis]|uniref:pyridoxal 5'-phosphate synthase n=1 Tax=Aspergillus puulaauensis TaxID=1220207 RepID=A0A7R7XV58_9EURO|nr:uncharacterized protein APUU_60422A [Aspergillus puulaauensis]BCS27374.1 hypothetical protein APUU_60422A [Aspergillus puulaauensis]
MTAIPNLRATLRTLPVLQSPSTKAIDLNDFPSTPEEAFIAWLNEAILAGTQEPHAMTLSTVDQHGCPDARVLSLKDVDSRGWHFAVNGHSPKAEQLDLNQNVALTFHWREVGRQIRIRGKAALLSEEECRRDFQERPVRSKVAMLASKQSQRLESRGELDARVLEVEEGLLEGADLGLMGESALRVYAVKPSMVEFWQGSRDRLHRRIRFITNGDRDAWVKELLWP